MFDTATRSPKLARQVAPFRCRLRINRDRSVTLLRPFVPGKLSTRVHMSMPISNHLASNPLIPPPLVVAVLAFLMWAVDRRLEYGGFESPLLPVIAVLFLVVGLTLMVAAAAAIVAAGTTINPLRPSRTSSLVTSSVFRLSRNPIYLGDLLILLALAVWLGHLFNIVLVGVFVWYINRYQIAPEERALTTLFGASYIDYCARVRRWL